MKVNYGHGIRNFAALVRGPILGYANQVAARNELRDFADTYYLLNISFTILCTI